MAGNQRDRGVRNGHGGGCKYAPLSRAAGRIVTAAGGALRAALACGGRSAGGRRDIRAGCVPISGGGGSARLRTSGGISTGPVRDVALVSGRRLDRKAGVSARGAAGGGDSLPRGSRDDAARAAVSGLSRLSFHFARQ